jgi:RHS repeat-associated protein
VVYDTPMSTSIYVYNAQGQMVAEYTTPAPSASGGTRYLIADHLSSTRVVTDATGAVVSRHDYLPFGESIPTGIGGRTTGMGYEDPDGINQKFTAKERDAESELDYFGARFLSSELGRFLSVDPTRLSVSLTNPQSWNLYSYALNNPVVYNDPNGKWTTRAHDEIIDIALGDVLSDKDRNWIRQASEYLDAWTQGPEEAFKHAMSSPGGAPFEDRAFEASQAAGKWVDDNLNDAVRDQLYFENHGGSGYDILALTNFGYALHTVTDSKSPEHEGYQEWLGIGGHLGRAGRHYFAEAYHGYTDEEAKHNAIVAARLLWLQFQRKLQEARDAEACKNGDTTRCKPKKKAGTIRKDDSKGKP